MAAAVHLVAVYVATAGRDGPHLGSDERGIVSVALAVVDTFRGQVTAVEHRPVRPDDDWLPEGEVACTAQPLEDVIRQFDHYVKAKLNGDYGPSFQFITDGQLHLRQVLHPEAHRKNIQLPDYYYKFFDLRKEFRKFYKLKDCCCIQDMLDYLDLEEDRSVEPTVRWVQNMAKIILRLSSDGHQFQESEVINNGLQLGICLKNEKIDDKTVVRARGLPWQSSDRDVADFFRGLNIVRGGVALCLGPQGRRNGEALVRFVDEEHCDMALKRHKHHIGHRYIEVYRATGQDFVSVAGGSSNEAQSFLSRGGQVIIRMRGLPYDCTTSQVMEFFSRGQNACRVMDDDKGVLFVKKSDGRPTGDAFVLFQKEEEAEKALQKHREVIGSRYIELFRSTTAEVQQVLNRNLDPKSYEPIAQPLITNHPQPISILPNQVLMVTGSKDCIRLRGLPYEARVEHILEFLGDFAKNIVLQGVHMVYNSQTQPSGEAYVQMDSEQSARAAAHHRHHRYMVYGKKQRYIEVFQCSSDDMNFLAGGRFPLRASLLSPGSSIISAAYNAYPYLQHAQLLPATITPRIPTYYPSLIYLPFTGPVSSATYYPNSAETVLSSDCLQRQKIGESRQNQDFSTNMIEESDIVEKNGQNIGRQYIELFMT